MNRAPAPLIAVPLGVVTVVLIHSPRALIPQAPYWPWLMVLSASALFGLVLQLGLEDGGDDLDHVMRWKAAGLAYVLGVLASVTFLVSVWLVSS